VMTTAAMARTLPKTAQLKKRVRFILQRCYRFGCSRQVVFPAHTQNCGAPSCEKDATQYGAGCL
jgi:hypothetical protein